jgi:hypothetical protein
MGKKKKKARPRRLRFIAGAAAVLVLAAALTALFRSRPVWLVEESLSADWNRVLRQSSVRPPFSRIQVIPEDGAVPPRTWGFIITTRTSRAAGEGEGPVTVYPWLSRTREWKGALVLAANPWMVFRKHKDPAPDRRRFDSFAGGDGVLICPGGEQPAVFAWTSQLLQDSPGSFPGDSLIWREAERDLFTGRRFQNGAMTYRWIDVWPLLYGNSLAWVYAPLNMIRELPSYRMGLLEASRFPEKDGWNEYGVQADLLWAVPFGGQRQTKKLNRAAEWLKDAAIQTDIADIINWIPAHPQGVPYNPVTWEAQVAWINSSFVWQGAEHAQEIGY